MWIYVILFHNNNMKVNTSTQWYFIKFKGDNASMTSDNDLSSQLLRSLRQNGVKFKAYLIDR